jgi:hypothetical protein
VDRLRCRDRRRHRAAAPQQGRPPPGAHCGRGAVRRRRRALLHVINLAAGAASSGFADPAYFPWVTSAWQAVVVPHAVVFIGLLALFEAVVGILAVAGGRATQIGYAGVIAFYLLLWLFGWMELVWVLVLIVPMLVLLRAERLAAPVGAAEPASAAGAGR